MRRLLAVAGLLLAGAVAAPAAARAASVQVVSCPHLHLVYSMTAPVTTDTAYPLSVTPSDCTDGGTVTTGATGSGSVTFLSLQDDGTCLGGVFLECDRFSLSLAIGGSSVTPGFQTFGPDYFQFVSAGAGDVPPTTFDYGNAGTITSFAGGHGSGGINTVCTFTNPTFRCSADGAFTWAPGV